MPSSGDALVIAGLSIDDVVRSSSLGLRTVRRAIADGKLPAKKFGRRVVVLPSDLDAFMRGLPPADQVAA